MDVPELLSQLVEIMIFAKFDELVVCLAFPGWTISPAFCDTALLCCCWFCIGWLVGTSFLVRLHPFLEAKDSQLFHLFLFVPHWWSPFAVYWFLLTLSIAMNFLHVGYFPLFLELSSFQKNPHENTSFCLYRNNLKFNIKFERLKFVIKFQVLCIPEGQSTWNLTPFPHFLVLFFISYYVKCLH